jgi:hypothetical protein
VPAPRRSSGKVRKSVTLTPEDRQELDRIREPNSQLRTALERIAGVELQENASEAEVLHALVVAGRAAVVEQMMDAGYAEWAASTAEASTRRDAPARATAGRGRRAGVTTEPNEDRAFEDAMRGRVRDRRGDN